MDPLTIGLGLAQLVPGMIRLFGGGDKAEKVAEKVVDIAKTVTGQDTGEAALEALKADPNKILEFQRAIEAQRVDLEKAYLADVASAREMQIAALGQEDQFSKRFVYYFSMAWSLFAMAYFLAVTFIEVPPAGIRIADTILGVLIGTVLVGIFHYFFGSTSGGKLKSELLAARSKQ